MNQIFEKEINDKLKHKFSGIFKENFKEFYNGLSSEIKRLDNANDREILIKNMAMSIRKTKTRWVNKILTDKNGPIVKEISYAEFKYNSLLAGEITKAEFKKFSSAATFEEFKDKLIDPLNKWKDDPESLLTDFKYFKTLSKYSIKTAFKNDILKMYSNFESGEVNTTKIPSILGDIPIETTNRVYFLTDEQRKSLDEGLDSIRDGTIDRIVMIGEEAEEELLLQLEKSTYLNIKSGGNPTVLEDLMTQIALIKAVKTLNKLDTMIIRYYYTHFHKIVLGEPIIKSIGDICKDIGLSHSGSNFEAIIDSIAKLGSMNITHNYKGNSINGGFLTSYIYQIEGKTFAKVQLGDILNNLILRNSTYSFDENIFNNLCADAQQLLAWLQKRRYKTVLNQVDRIDRIHIKAFANAIYWNTKVLAKQRTRIMAALSDLKNNNIIVKDFMYDKKAFTFEVEYIDLPENEKDKLLNEDGDSNKVLLSGTHTIIE